MPDDQRPTPRAGPDTIQRFNAVRAIVLAPIILVVAVVYLVDRITRGESIVVALLLVVLGVVVAVVAILLTRRHVVRRDGLTLDEADPRRTPEQQRQRDDRVRAQNRELTPRQELLLGILLVPGGVVVFAIPALLGNEPDAGDLLLSIGLIVLGAGTLIHGMVLAIRRRIRRG